MGIQFASLPLVLSRLFRRMFLQGLQQAFDAGDLHFIHGLAMLHEPQALPPIWRPRGRPSGFISNAIFELPIFEHYAFDLETPYGSVLSLDMQANACI